MADGRLTVEVPYPRGRRAEAAEIREAVERDLVADARVHDDARAATLESEPTNGS